MCKNIFIPVKQQGSTLYSAEYVKPFCSNSLWHGTEGPEVYGLRSYQIKSSFSNRRYNHRHDFLIFLLHSATIFMKFIGAYFGISPSILFPTWDFLWKCGPAFQSKGPIVPLGLLYKSLTHLAQWSLE